MNATLNAPVNLREFLAQDAARVAASNMGRDVGPMHTWDESAGFVREWGNWPAIWSAIPYTPDQRARAEEASARRWRGLAEFPVLDGESEAQYCARAVEAGVA